MDRKKRLFWQLYPSYLLITLIPLLAVTWYGAHSFREFHYQNVVADLESRAQLLEKQVSNHVVSIDAKGLDLLCKELGKRSSTRITVILTSGKVIGDSQEDPGVMDNHSNLPEVAEALAGGTGSSLRYSQTLAKNMMYVAIPLIINDRITGVVRTSVPVTSIDEALRNIEWKIAFGGLTIALIAAVFGLIVSRRISRPLEELKKGAEKFAGGDLAHRLPVPDSEETAALARSMNQMARELDERIKSVIRQRNELDSVLSSMEEGVVAVDMQERLISMNRAAAQMLGIEPSKAQGRNIQEVIRNINLQKFLTKTLSGHEPVQENITLYSNGERILNARGTLLFDARETRIGALMVLNDVTELRWLENLRSDFVANLSHEIKTPITAIKGSAETLQEGAMDNPEESRRFLGIIRRHVDRLDAIVEDLLSLSRIEYESGRGLVSLAEGSINAVVHTAIQVCHEKARESGINVAFKSEKDFTASIDPQLLELALINLLDNAIRYSGSGSQVLIDMTQTDTESVISFLDQGIGIEKIHLPRLFERFYRVDKARSRQKGGTGLGLAIVKHIVQAHGGNVTVESTPGKGSTFRVHLARKQTSSSPESSSIPSFPRGHRESV